MEVNKGWASSSLPICPGIQSAFLWRPWLVSRGRCSVCPYVRPLCRRHSSVCAVLCSVVLHRPRYDLCTQRFVSRPSFDCDAGSVLVVGVVAVWLPPGPAAPAADAAVPPPPPPPSAAAALVG